MRPGMLDEAACLSQARAFPGLAGMDLAKEVTAESESYAWTEGELAARQGARHPGRR
jgi:carbamoyl-phosphate synthase small subunit